MIKIGVDFHGVLEDCKDSRTIKLLLYELRNYYFVYIVSGPPMKQLTSELVESGYEIGLHFDAIISTVDFIKSKNIDMWQDKKGDWWTDEKTWNASKSMVCDDYEIDLLIDDMECYRDSLKSNVNFYLYKDMERFIYLIAKLIDEKASKNCK